LSTISLLHVSAHRGSMSRCTSYKYKLLRYHYVACHRSSYTLTNIEYCCKDAEIKEDREILNRSFYVYNFVEIIQFSVCFVCIIMQFYTSCSQILNLIKALQIRLTTILKSRGDKGSSLLRPLLILMLDSSASVW